MEASSKLVGAGVRFERIRRITGYLVGTTDRFNNAKRAEERDRVKHAALDAWPRQDGGAADGCAAQTVRV
ncbi:MAG TPA: hypothetical protein IAB01_04485 [Candidatus Avidesulfovibrio excrementigallinarum]|nr:hypothetical protein [Candidatus Avidesulfovibrio excrementigallinarum]